MNRLALLCGVMLLFAGIASAQDDSTKWEAFGGYSYLRFNPGDGANGENFNGGSGSVAYNLTPMVGIVADFGGYHWSQGFGDGETESITAVSYLFGPKVSLHHGRFTPFAQALFGGAHASINATNVCTARVHPQGGEGCDNNPSLSQNVFAMAIGGGADWNVTSHIGIRLIQAEYLLTRFSLDNNSQNNARISTGVTIRF